MSSRWPYSVAIALVELFCEHGGWIRVWYSEAIWGTPYDYHMGYKIEGGYANIKGFNRDKIPRDEYETIISAVNKTTGYLVSYDRYNRSPPMRSVQLPLGLTKGKILMAKESIHHTDEAIVGGEIDQATVIAHARHALQQIEDGHHKIVALGEYTLKSDDEHPTVEDVLDGFDLTAGDQVYIFVRRELATGPGNQGNNPPRQ